MSFAAAPAVKAVHEEGIFELDGNATNDAAVAGDDWNSHPGATGSHFVLINDPLDQATDKIFTGGGSKDDLNTTGWQWTTGSVPDKDNIEHAFAASYQNNGETFVYFGLDRYANNGDAQVGFWFFKNGIGTTASGGFAPAHSVGDLLVLSDFTNGGTVSTITIYEWVGSGGDTNGTLDLVATGNACTGAPAVDKACAVANTGNANAPWTYTPKAGTANVFPKASFFEGGINLNELFGGDAPCFSGFLAETRSSQSVDAVLKDVAVGEFNTCEPPKISTTASKSTIFVGDSVTDTADFTGNSPAVTGTVDFFVCGPANGNPDCSTGGTKVGATKTISGGTATSAAFTPANTSAVGNYCFRAEYTPDAAGSNHYLPGSHTNRTTECFEVKATQPTISTAANQSVSVGNAISDSATIAGGTQDIGGTVVFKAYGPNDTNCSNTAAFTSSPVAVNGNGTVGPVSFTPATAGTYRWIAYYSGDAKNLPAAGACNDAGETDTVTKVSPTISTQASASVTVGGTISDTASVSGGHNPTGNVTFKLYGPDNATCAGDPIFTSTVALSANGTATSGNFTTTQAGTYRWVASYAGDANNNAVAGNCNDANESVVVTKASPTISTILQGGGQEGASITVPLGTAVNDTSALSGATANAGGTVHYQVFSDTKCETKVADAGTKSVTNGVVTNSDQVVFVNAGTYYWQADYSGDANNDAASSACTLEVVTVQQNIPTITTSANETVTIGAEIHDTAQLSGTFNATGTITFKLYGDATCAGPIVSEQTRTVSGNGSYGPVSFTPTQPGTYRWIASYSGDNNNAMVSGACNDTGEVDTVAKAAPSIATVASDDVTVGGTISDTATVTGGQSPTGTVTFKLYGPDNATCAGDPMFTSTVDLGANGIATSAAFTTSATGTYRWVASYSGDANNEGAAGACNDDNESVDVTPATPTIETVASGSVTVGGQISDTATVSGGYNPTGTVTFQLYGPDDATCAGTPIFTSADRPLENGDASSASFTATQAGTYRWIASYSGDDNNNAVAGACNDANESVVVTKDQPEIETTATEGGVPGDLISDTATVSGGYNPTGTVTFWLFAAGDKECTGEPIFTSTVNLGADGTATSGTYEVQAPGMYHWVASYLGDANNEAATGTCGDEGETTVIRQFNPEITTSLSSGNESGPKITVVFGSSVTDQATLTGASATAGGSVTYTVYTDNECSNEYADAGVKTVTNGVAPASNAVVFPDAGTYYWQASYSGDQNNAPATSPCTDEVLTVTTPNLEVTKLVKTNGGSFAGTSTAEPGDTLTFQITIHNSGSAAATNVPVSDDIAAVLAHADYNDDCNLSCTLVDGHELQWTIDEIGVDETVTLTFSVTLDASFPQGTTHLPNVIVVTGPGSNCAAESQDPDCDTDTTVEAQPDLDVTKLVKTNGGSFAGTSTAEPGDTLTFQITIQNTGNAPATDVPVSDDIAALLAHAEYNDDCNLSCTVVDGHELRWTVDAIAAGGSVTLTFSVTLDGSFPVGTTQLPNVVVVTGPGSNCAAQSEDPDCDTNTTVDERALLIDKSFTGNTGGVFTSEDPSSPFNGMPIANEGDVLTYTLAYDISNPPVHNGVITDVLPVGLAYVAGSATSNDEFDFVSFDEATRTLTWTSPLVTSDSFVTYQVQVLAGAAELEQPLRNVAAIDSDETDRDEDDANVLVAEPPQELTPPPSVPPTLPPTSTDFPQEGGSNPGFSLMLVLLGLAGFVLAVGFITPVPARVRRRERRG